jgi:hypothetical protein
VEVKPEDEDKFAEVMKGQPTAKLGAIHGEKISIKGAPEKRLIDVAVEDCYSSWVSRFSKPWSG